MLATFDTVAEVAKYSPAQQAGSIAHETTTVLQGAGALSMAKSGVAGTVAIARRKFSIPIDIQRLRDSLRNPFLKFRAYHTAWSASNVTKIWVRLVYRYSTAGVPDIYDQFDLLAAGLTNSQWSVGSVSLKTPSSSSGHIADPRMHRSLCQGIDLGIETTNNADTITNVKWDAVDIEAEEGTAQPGVLVAGVDRLMVPPFDVWKRTLMGGVQVVDAPQASETNFIERREDLEVGLGSVREVYNALTNAHGLEEGLRRFGQYMEENNTFGVAWPAKQLIDITVGTANAAEATSIVASQSRDFGFLGLDGTLDTKFADLRIGPNDSRNSEVARAIGFSGTTVYLDRPLRFAHEVGTPIRSLRYYPSLTRTGDASPVSEDNPVRFTLSGKEFI